LVGGGRSVGWNPGKNFLQNGKFTQMVDSLDIRTLPYRTFGKIGGVCFKSAGIQNAREEQLKEQNELEAGFHPTKLLRT